MDWTQTAIDTKFSALKEDELLFLKTQVGIEDSGALTRHVASVASRAMKIYPYTCLLLNFLKFKLPSLPAYRRLLEMPSATRARVIFLDLGSCLGQDVRKAVADGFSPLNIVATDIRPEFWNLGHELFRSTPATFPAAFVPGNLFDPSFLPDKVLYPASRIHQTSLHTLKSLAPLQRHVSVIHASSLFHLFDAPQQRLLARKLVTLLSLTAGSVIFGMQQGNYVEGEVVNPRQERVYLHSPDSWKELWEGLFPKGTVRIDVDWMKNVVTGTSAKILVMSWSVTRI
ncbi:hypothetical protein K435DRAFT_652479 [Dendrothele bispora CBS 962.96]|uniref:Methyltransferase domain-containing protein n=1 Tax=Dendrothele bispora (strain CBS 962.96) TaxID=1314807 RepID=A0A4S8MJ55_DENBC|nr:hypothetical protein K435DRAFT_652479 [Dendrothele bispora CBS 962.96]